MPLGFALALATIPLVRLPAHRRRLRAARDDNGWRALLRLVHAAADARRGLDEAAVDQAWRDATRETLSPQRRTQLLLEAGGDLEIAADGSTAWRFAALEREQQALAAARASTTTSVPSARSCSAATRERSVHAGLTRTSGGSSVARHMYQLAIER
ncbi:MAG: hypothetical protein U0168_18255 [Nannocystaceae bacterium]